MVKFNPLGLNYKLVDRKRGKVKSYGTEKETIFKLYKCL